MKIMSRPSGGRLEMAARYEWHSPPCFQSKRNEGKKMLLSASFLLTLFVTVSLSGSTSTAQTESVAAPVLQSLAISAKVQDGGGLPTILWDKDFGGALDDRVTTAIPTTDGGYLLAGFSQSYAFGDKSENSRGWSDYWILKIDGQNNKQWDKTFGGDRFDEPFSVIQTPDGGYLLAGWSESTVSGDKSEPSRGLHDGWLVKVDNLGNKVWDRTYGGTGEDFLFSAISVPGGGYLLAGYSASNASGEKSANSKGGFDYWILRIDNLGNKVWDKTIGGSSDDLLKSITPNADGYLLGGESSSNASGDKSQNSKGSSDFWIVKIDKQGNKKWDKTIGGGDVENYSSTTPTADGGYLLGGQSSSNASGDKSENSKGVMDYWVVKIDKHGNKAWDKTLGGSLVEGFNCAASTPDGGYLLGGFSWSNASGDKSEDTRGGIFPDFWVVKTDRRGNKVWDKTIGGDSNDQLVSIIPTPGGNYLLAGSAYSEASGDKSQNTKGGPYDYWVVGLKLPVDHAIKSLTLMNAHNDQEIKELNDGDVIPKGIASKFLNIRANTRAEKISQVVFDLKGPVTHQQTEKVPPYALFGDTNGNFDGRKLPPGPYSLTVTPYISGVKGEGLSVTFTVSGDDATTQLHVKVYPIPATGVINISHEGKTEQAFMTLMDANGKVLQQRPFSQQAVEQMDVSGCRKGIHYLTVTTPTGSQIIRVVIE
ncbi:MAG TPA: T9SS type A sorting domain-containing protein [Chryseolinea sp.]|nr:T9SS type A sorting domain-containing protein [Chryseolinea sp.]